MRDPRLNAPMHACHMDGTRRHGNTRERGPALPPCSVTGAGHLPPDPCLAGTRSPAALDGRRLVEIGDADLRGLRRAALQGHCALAQLLVAALAIVLDRHGAHQDGSISLLHSGTAADGAHPAKGAAVGNGRERDLMPLDMRLAIAGGAAALTHPVAAGGGIAFRHVRQPREHDRAGVGRTAAACPSGESFELVFEVNEFDDKLRVECIFRTSVRSERAVGRLLHAYVHELRDLAAASDDGP